MMELDLTIDDNDFETNLNHEKTSEATASVSLGFNCNPDSKQINEKSFLVYKDVEKFLHTSTIKDGLSTCFGRKLHADLIDEAYIMDAMFNRACLSYNIIKTSTSYNSILERKPNIKVERCHISNYLQVIRNLNFQSEITKSHIRRNISSLYNLIGPVSSIECEISFVKQFDNPYHLMHGHLDWKWLILTILLKLETQPNSGNVILEGTKFEKLSKIIIYDLLQFAIKRFNKVKICDLCSTSPFPCICFKEFWMLLHILLENYNISFWNQLSMCLKLINDGTNIYELYNEPILNRKFKNVEVNKYDLFTVWIYSYLSHATDMDVSSFNNLSYENDYEFLEKLTTSFLVNNPSEQELRVYLFNLKGVVMPWQPKIEVLMAFWNYYHKQLNTSCGLPGSTISYTSSKSILNSEDILKSIKTNCSQEKLNENQTSFTMFTNILCCLIKHLKLIEKQNQIDKILGRIYSRLPQSKLVLLAETGLNNTATLLITLCLATSHREVLNKVADIIMQYPIEKVNESRQNCVIKIHMMLVMLLIENNLNVESYLEKLQSRVNDMFNKMTEHDGKPFHILKVIFDGFMCIFQSDGPFLLGEHVLFGPCIMHYLNHASTSELDRLFELTNRILLQINCRDDEDSEKLYNSIYDNLYGFVKKKFADLNNSKHIATLASNMCACYCDRTKFENVINDFVEVDCRDIKQFLQFWVNLTKSENAYYIKQSLIIKSWIKCCLLTLNEEDDVDLKEFSQYVFELEEFKEVCSKSFQNADGNFTMTKCILHKFFHHVESTFSQMSSATDRSKLIDKFQYYFMDLEKWVPPQASHSRDFTIKLFKVISNLILFCGGIAYQRQKPSNIFNTIMENYVMPVNLLMGRKIPDLTTTQSVHYVFPMLIYGLSKMDYARDAQLKMYLSNLVEKWFPHFHLVSRKTDVIVKPFVHISNKCDGPLLSFLCRKLALHFITVKSSQQPHSQACLAITVIKEMFTSIKLKAQDDKLCILVESTMYDLMVHAFRTNDGAPSNKSILLYFVEISEFMKQDNCPKQIKDTYMDSIRNLIKSYLSYQTEACLRFFVRIIKLNPANGIDLLQMIKLEFSELQKIRKNDIFLQNLFTKFEKSIKELCNK